MLCSSGGKGEGGEIAVALLGLKVLHLAQRYTGSLFHAQETNVGLQFFLFRRLSGITFVGEMTGLVTLVTNYVTPGGLSRTI